MAMSDDPPASPRGVLETCLYAENLAETARFYERVLGLPVIMREPDRHVFFRSGNGVFLLFDPRRTRATDGEVPAHGTTGPGHVAFAVERASLAEWRDHLLRSGVAIESEVAWPRGGTSLYLRDPAGNSVELTSPSIWGISEV